MTGYVGTSYPASIRPDAGLALEEVDSNSAAEPDAPKPVTLEDRREDFFDSFDEVVLYGFLALVFLVMVAILIWLDNTPPADAYYIRSTARPPLSIVILVTLALGSSIICAALAVFSLKRVLVAWIPVRVYLKREAARDYDEWKPTEQSAQDQSSSQQV